MSGDVTGVETPIHRRGAEPRHRDSQSKLFNSLRKLSGLGGEDYSRAARKFLNPPIQKRSAVTLDQESRCDEFRQLIKHRSLRR